MSGSPKLADPRLARVSQSRSPSVAFPPLSRCHAGSPVRDLGFPVQSRAPVPLLAYSVPRPSLPGPHHCRSSAIPRSVLLWRWGQPLSPGIDIPWSRVDGAPSTQRGGRTGLTAPPIPCSSHPPGRPRRTADANGRRPRGNRASAGAGLEKEGFTVPRVS